jgi:uncharacterized GH25 family protein
MITLAGRITRVNNRKLALFTTLLRHIGFVAIVASPVSAHDLYLTHENGHEVCAGIGEHFPASMNAVTADRLLAFNARLGSERLSLKGAVKLKRYCAPLKVQSFVAEMTVQPRFIKLGSKDFNSYLHGEGLTNVEELRKDARATETEGREMYSRYAKLLVGQLGDRANQVLGHSLEIVPLHDPASLKSGQAFKVRVLFKGKPLRDAQVSAVYANAKLKGHSYPVTTRTNVEGVAELKLDRAGLWYARLIYMEPAQNDPEVDWRSYFATLTFRIPSGT